MNEYYQTLKFVKAKIVEYLSQIFKVYGNELLLRLEEYNLLTNKNNCIETSTATGFIMEEFITSKLEIYSKSHNDIDEIKIRKLEGLSTTNSSYDCYVEYNDILFMVNIKVEKKGSNNNAVSAINILQNDYVFGQPEKEKAYLVLKTRYYFDVSKKDNQRKIMISSVDGYYLEEIDFSSGHKQDHRNWSKKEFKPESGRLMISNTFRKSHLLNEEDISYFRTRDFLQNINAGK